MICDSRHFPRVCEHSNISTGRRLRPFIHLNVLCSFKTDKLHSLLLWKVRTTQVFFVLRNKNVISSQILSIMDYITSLWICRISIYTNVYILTNTQFACRYIFVQTYDVQNTRYLRLNVTFFLTLWSSCLHTLNTS